MRSVGKLMAEWPLATPVYIRLDLVPADVDGIQQTVRAIVTDAHFYFFVDTTNGPDALISGALYDLEGRNTIGYTLTVDDEERTVYLFRRGRGCACGSKLRGFRPFPGVPMQASF